MTPGSSAFFRDVDIAARAFLPVWSSAVPARACWFLMRGSAELNCVC
eukprot:COSAG02_NODE_51549_length_313_cov_0.962617_1_plen_46_part_01